MEGKPDREISLKALREQHQAAYFTLAAMMWSVLGFIFLLDLLLLVSFFSTGTKATIVRSGSMEPAIKTGSMVIIVPQEEYGVGDVIDFISPRIGHNIHRIIYVVEDKGTTYFVTKGDALEFPDNYRVPSQEVKGKVVADFPYLGYVAYVGFFAALIPVSLIVLHFIRKRGPGDPTG